METFLDILSALRSALGDELLGCLAVVFILVLIFAGKLLNIPGFDESQPTHDINLHPGNRSTELGRNDQDAYLSMLADREAHGYSMKRSIGGWAMIVFVVIPITIIGVLSCIGLLFGGVFK